MASFNNNSGYRTVAEVDASERPPGLPLNAVMIPRSHDGRSAAFDPTVAGPVRIDPTNDDDDAIVFDPSKVSSQDMKAAVAAGKSPTDIYRMLVQRSFSKDKPVGPPPVPPVLEFKPLPVMPESAPNYNNQALSVNMQTTPLSNDTLSGALRDLANGMSMLTQLVQSQIVANQPKVKETPKRESKVVAEPEEPTLEPTLKLPWVAGELPKCRVIFDLGDAGTMSNYYHGVFDSEAGICLVYDNRCERMSQYLPPVNENRVITVTVPSLRLTYRVLSFGLAVAIGSLDVLFLVKGTDSQLD